MKQTIEQLISKEAIRFSNRKVGRHPEAPPADTITARHYRIGFGTGADYALNHLSQWASGECFPEKSGYYLYRSKFYRSDPNNVRVVLFRKEDSEWVMPDGKAPGYYDCEWCEIPK